MVVSKVAWLHCTISDGNWWKVTKYLCPFGFRVFVKPFDFCRSTIPSIFILFCHLRRTFDFASMSYYLERAKLTVPRLQYLLHSAPYHTVQYDILFCNLVPVWLYRIPFHNLSHFSLHPLPCHILLHSLYPITCYRMVSHTIICRIIYYYMLSHHKCHILSRAKPHNVL